MILSFFMLLSSPADLPSFSCAGELNDTEAVICGNAELAAYDRAVALLYNRAHPPVIAYQRMFLRERDTCRQQRECIAGAYREWLDYYGWDILISGGQENYRGLDAAFLYIMSVGSDWYLFRTSARTSESIPSSYAGGLVRINGGTGRFVEPRGPTNCTIIFEKLPANQWLIADNGGCGILPLTGRYGPRD